MSTVQPIGKAVIPVAGIGTRFFPVGKSVPKALLPVLNKPLIEYAVEEAAHCGIKQVALVLGPGMDAVANHFTPQPDLYATLEARGKAALADELRAIDSIVSVERLRQDEPRGLGHAVLQARDWVGDEPFAVILPDDLVVGGKPALEQLLEVYRRFGGNVLAAVRVPPRDIPSKGIVAGRPVGGGALEVTSIVEKPPLEEAPSDLSILGRYILSPALFKHLEEHRIGAGGEIQITDAIQSARATTKLHAVEVGGRHIDTGVPGGMLEAAMHQGLADLGMRAAMADFLGTELGGGR